MAQGAVGSVRGDAEPDAALEILRPQSDGDVLKRLAVSLRHFVPGTARGCGRARFEVPLAGCATAVRRQGSPGGGRSFDLLVEIWETGDELGCIFVAGGDGLGVDWSGCDESRK